MINQLTPIYTYLPRVSANTIEGMSGLIKAHFLQPISNNLHQNNSVLANYIDGFIYYFDRATATVVSIPRTIIEIMEIPSRGIILPLTQQQLQQSQQQLQQLQQQLQQSQQQLQQSQQQLQQSQQQLQQLQQEHRKSEAHKGGQSGEGEHKERKGRDEEQSSEDRRLQEEEGHGTGGTITVSNLRETWRRTERPDFIRPFQEFWQGQLDFNQMAEMYARMFRGELGRFVDEMDSRFVHQRQAWIAHQIHGLQDPLPSRTMVRRQLAQQWLPQGIGLLSLLERPPVLLAIELQPQPNAPQRSSYARILVIGIYNTIGVLAASSCITFAYFASPEDRPYFAAAALGFDGLVARDLYRGGMSSTKAVLASAAFVVSVAGIAL